MSEIIQDRIRIADIARDSNFQLWNALLTLNGIFVSVFSAVAIFNPEVKILSASIIGVSMVSALCLILNFRSTRDLYNIIGRMSINSPLALPIEQCKDNTAMATRSHTWCRRRENFAHLILFAQGSLIFTLVYFKS